MSRIAGLITPKAPSTFTVTLRPATGGYDGNRDRYIGYSLDGGTTYTDIKESKSTDTVINNVTTIKFRAYTGRIGYTSKVGTTNGGTQIVSGIDDSGFAFSSEITLSANTLYYIEAHDI